MVDTLSNQLFFLWLTLFNCRRTASYLFTVCLSVLVAGVITCKHVNVISQVEVKLKCLRVSFFNVSDSYMRLVTHLTRFTQTGQSSLSQLYIYIFFILAITLCNVRKYVSVAQT